VPAVSRRNARPLLWLLLVFGGPLVLAFWMYYGSHWRPALRTNHGALIDPPVSLPKLPIGTATANALEGKWSLVVVGSGPSGCDEGCRAALTYARQTWLSLGKLTPRVQRVLLAGEACCDRTYLAEQHRGLTVAQLPEPAVAAVLAALPAPLGHSIFIVDPLGNLMMRYDVGQDPKGLREDLKNLLELSHIG
jgi:hypothetical protein